MHQKNNKIYSEILFWPYHIPEMLALSIYFLTCLIVCLINNGVIFDEIDLGYIIYPAILPLLIINFSVMFVEITSNVLSFRYGFLGLTLKFDINKIQTIQVSNYKYKDFIGWDSPVGIKNWKNTYLFPVLTTKGLDISYLSKNNTIKHYFISHNEPEKLIEIISQQKNITL